MNINGIIKLIKTNLLIIITLVFVCAAVAYASTPHLKSGFTLEKDYFLKIENTNSLAQNTPNAQDLTDTTVALLGSANFQTDSSAASSAKKIAPQIITITTSSQSSQTTKTSQYNLIQKFNQNSHNLFIQTKVELVPMGAEEEPRLEILNKKVLATFGALIGLVVSFALIYIGKYLKI